MKRLASAIAFAGILAPLAAGTVFQDDFEGNPADQWQGIGNYWQAARTAGSGSQALHRVLYPGTKPSEKPMELPAKEAVAFAGGKFSYQVLCSGGSESNAPIRQVLALEFLDAAKKSLGIQEFELKSGPGGYRRSTGEVTPPAGAAFVRPILRVYVNGPIEKTAFVRFDQLVLGDDIAPEVKAPEKLNTINLEAPKLDLTFDNQGAGWQGIDGGSWRLTPTVHRGKGALQLITPPGTAAGSVAVLKSAVPVTVRGGEEFRLSAYIRTTDKALGTKQSIALTFRDADGRQVGEVLESRPLLSGINRYTELSELVKVPAGAVKADVALKVYFERPVTEEVKSYFDSIELAPWRDLLAGAAKTDVPAPAPVKLEDPNSGKLTAGNLGIGKFYQASRAPAPEYADRYPGRWTLGAKLTDGERRQGTTFVKPAYVGWGGPEPVALTVDLGEVQQLDSVDVSGFQDTEAYARLPQAVKVLVRSDEKGEFTPWGEWNEPAKIGKKDGSYRIAIKGKTAPARFVKLEFTPDANKANFLLLDEIELDGKIKNSWKMVPANGLYHGAFPPTYGFKEPLRGSRKLPMSLQTFEKLVGKKVSMVLWYQGLSPERNFGELQELRTYDLAENHYGQRFMAIGWLPPATVSPEDIASGKLDDYFYEYFSDSIDDVKTLGDHTPIWFRPMNEFNSGWVNWGLDPDGFRAAWRRMFNIAEQVGATKRHIFVWSPNHRSYPDVEWNKMERYYPGDQYVDWVGLSCYPPSAQYVNGDEDARYPLARCKEVNSKYGDRKPMMVAEGGFSKASDQVRWVREWFEVEKRYPNFKAMIWENHNDRVLQDQPEALKLYQDLVKSPYWISETYTGK